jgi:kynurenine formamidase
MPIAPIPYLRPCLAAALLALTLTGASAALQAETSLADAYRVIASRRFVDLTHSFGTGTPVWSGFGQATMSAAADPQTHMPYTIETAGFRSIFYALVGQYGTHVDPPAHFDPTGITMDRIPLEQMILPLIVLDNTPYQSHDPDHAFNLADLNAWEQEHGEVPRGSFAALRTDMYKDWDKDPVRFKRHPFPAWSLGVVKQLVEERGVTAIGHEALDTDITEQMEAETWLLRSGHYQIEVMANLDQVPATGAIIVVTWPKVENGFGFPARAFAILP